MIRPAITVIVLGGLVLVPLAACAAAPDAAVEAGQSDPCDLLADDAARALAGEPMTSANRVDIGGLPACQMSGATRGIQVARVPAVVWAESMPGLIDQLRSAGGLGEENQGRFDEMATRFAAGELDALAACELFSTMAELGGQRPGLSRTVAYLPDGVAPQAISAQSCVDGTYASVLFVGPDIAVSREVEAAIEAALDLVEAG